MTAVDIPGTRITVTREGEHIRLSGVDNQGRAVTLNLSRLAADRLGIRLVMAADVNIDVMGES